MKNLFLILSLFIAFNANAVIRDSEVTTKKVADANITLAKLATAATPYIYEVMTVTNCSSDWLKSGSTVASFGTQTSCSYSFLKSRCTAPATNIPGMQCTLPAGDYILTYIGSYGPNNTGGLNCQASAYDGTNTWSGMNNTYQASLTGLLVGHPTLRFFKSYASNQSNATIEIRTAELTNGGNNCRLAGTSTTNAIFILEFFPIK